MAVTLTADMIEPAIWLPYFTQRLREADEILKSGIAVYDARLESTLREGGRKIDMPFWNEIGGDAKNWDDTTEMTPDKITANQEEAVKLSRYNAWAVHDLVPAWSGSSAMNAIETQLVPFWLNTQERILVSVLKGIFGVSGMSGSINDISGATGDAAIISSNALIDTMMKLGIYFTQLTALMVSPTVYGVLLKQDNIDFYRPSEGRDIMLYRGKPIVICQSLDNTTLFPDVANGIYNTYLFGRGAFSICDGAPLGQTLMEVQRRAEFSTDYLYHRRFMIYHPHGFAFNVPLTNAMFANGGTPTNANLATADNWTLASTRDRVPITLLRHRIVAAPIAKAVKS
jgi:hypothetical protein